MKRLMLIVLISPISYLFGQQLDRQIISSGGSATHEFTIGESIISSANILITVGFQQTNERVNAEDETLNIEDISYQLKVYPNPATDIVTISGYGIGENIQVDIFTTSGIRVSPTVEKNHENISIQFHELPSGNYFLRLTDHDAHTTANFKLLKIN